MQPMKTNLTTTKIPLSGKHAYGQLLIKNHIKLMEKYLTKLSINPDSKRVIRKLYKKEITLENITRVYQHSMPTFLNALIDGNIESLYTFTEATFVTIKKS
jgi:hypothetical protein